MTRARLNVVLVADESAGIQVPKWLAGGDHRIVAEGLVLQALDPALVTSAAFARAHEGK